MVKIDWKKPSETENWADFNEDGLRPFEGDKEQECCVYLIWSECERRMVYVGSGKVDRLWDHLNPSDPAYERIHAYTNLKATYALIDGKYMHGAEHYLYQVYKPLAVKASPQDNFVEVSLPDNIDVSYRSDIAKETTDGTRAMRSLFDTIKDQMKNR